MPRIADCGGLTIGVDSIEPNTPPLVIVNVPPVISSIVSLPSRALPAKSAIYFSMSAKLMLIRIAQDRHHEAASVETATPMSK